MQGATRRGHCLKFGWTPWKMAVRWQSLFCAKSDHWLLLKLTAVWCIPQSFSLFSPNTFVETSSIESTDLKYHYTCQQCSHLPKHSHNTPCMQFPKIVPTGMGWTSSVEDQRRTSQTRTICASSSMVQVGPTKVQNHKTKYKWVHRILGGDGLRKGGNAPWVTDSHGCNSLLNLPTYFALYLKISHGSSNWGWGSGVTCSQFTVTLLRVVLYT